MSDKPGSGEPWYVFVLLIAIAVWCSSEHFCLIEWIWLTVFAAAIVYSIFDATRKWWQDRKKARSMRDFSGR